MSIGVGLDRRVGRERLVGRGVALPGRGGIPGGRSGGPVVLGRQPRRVGRRRGGRRLRRGRRWRPLSGRRRALRRRRSRWRGDGRRGRGCLGREHRARRGRRVDRAERARVGTRVPRRLVGLHLVHRFLGLGIEDGLDDGVGDRDRPARRGQVDVVDLGPRRGRLDLAGEVLEVGLDRGADALAVPRRVRVERVGVGAQLLTARRQVEDLGLESTAFTFGDAAGGGFRVADERLRLRLRLLQQLARARLRLVHRVVGGALREQQRALQHVGVFATRRERHLRRHCHCRSRGCGLRGGGRGAAGSFLQLLRQALDGDGRPLEQIVDLVTVVAAPRVLDLAAPEFLRGHVHGRPW